jgi:hypothetical protein
MGIKFEVDGYAVWQHVRGIETTVEVTTIGTRITAGFEKERAASDRAGLLRMALRPRIGMALTVERPCGCASTDERRGLPTLECLSSLGRYLHHCRL